MAGFAAFTMANVKGQMAREEGEMLIQLEAGFTAQEIAADYNWLQEGKLVSKTMRIHNFSFEDGPDAGVFLELIKQDQRVTDAQFNHLVKRRCNEINDPQYAQQWHHNNTGQSGGIPDADIDSDLAWTITTGGLTANGDSIVVCVIEGGNLNHSDLQANAWRNYNEIPNNNIDDDNNGYVDDYLGWDVNTNSDGGSVLNGAHGTNVMGMIGATGGNEIAVIGANWDVKIMSVSGENIFNESSVIEAYSYPLDMRKLYNETNGEFGAFVVATNASWGIDGGNPNSVPLWNNTYDSLGVHGVLNCGATTNSPLNVDVEGDIPTALPSDYMVSVTATNVADVRTFSGFGETTIDVGAPGDNVVTTQGSNGVTSTSGTSFASPLTAGVIALLYSAPSQGFSDFVNDDPQGGADLVRQALFDGVDIVPALVGETVTGGRINAFNSLIEILETFGENDICIPPLALESSLENDTIYTFTWTNLTENPSTLRFKPEDSEIWVVIDSISDGQLVLDTLSDCTTYAIEVGSACEEGGDIVYSSCTTITTKGCGACTDNEYCTSLGEDSSEEYIESVSIGDFTFDTGNNGGYVLFDDFEFFLSQGETYNVELNPGFSGQQYDEYFKVWIDFNHSGTFTTSEIVFESEEGSPNPVSGQFIIPEDAELGATRMRVSMKYVGFPVTSENVLACEDYQWGETEDYCLTIEPGVLSLAEENDAVELFNVFPNPSSGDFNLEFKLSGEYTSESAIFRVFDITGKEVETLILREGLHQISTTDLENGMYIYNLQTMDGTSLKTGKWIKSL